MLNAPIPVNETQRVASLRALNLLDTPADERFDRITRMAQRMFGVETSLLGLIDSNRLWLKSKQGFDGEGIPRDLAFCSHAILGEDVFVVGDALADPRFEDSPLVAGHPGFRFYAGCPIRSPDGQRIGTFSILDTNPRGFAEADKAILRDLAALVEDECRASAEASVDSLTGIANRRGFLTVAGHMLALCRRSNAVAELITFRVEGGQSDASQQSQSAVAKRLCAFAELLRASFRAADVVARTGDSEFVVLLTAGKDAAGLAVTRLAELASAEASKAKASGNRQGDRLTDLQWRSANVQFDARRHADVESLLSDAALRLEDSRVEGRSMEA